MTATSDLSDDDAAELAAQVEEMQAVHDRMWQALTAISTGLPEDLADRLAGADEAVSTLQSELRRQAAALARLGARKGIVSEPQYANLDHWVRDWLVPRFEREPSDIWRWCAQWWDHTGAVTVLTAMWWSWEAADADPPLGPARWWREVYLPLGGLLTAGQGPFADCRATKGEEKHNLVPVSPCVPSPPERAVTWPTALAAEKAPTRRRRRAGTSNPGPVLVEVSDRD